MLALQGTAETMFHKFYLSPVHTVAENGDSRTFLRQIVAEIGDYSRQCEQAFSRPQSVWFGAL